MGSRACFNAGPNKKLRLQGMARTTTSKTYKPIRTFIAPSVVESNFVYSPCSSDQVGNLQAQAPRNAGKPCRINRFASAAKAAILRLHRPKQFKAQTRVGVKLAVDSRPSRSSKPRCEVMFNLLTLPALIGTLPILYLKFSSNAAHAEHAVPVRPGDFEELRQPSGQPNRFCGKRTFKQEQP